MIKFKKIPKAIAEKIVLEKVYGDSLDKDAVTSYRCRLEGISWDATQNPPQELVTLLGLRLGFLDADKMVYQMDWLLGKRDWYLRSDSKIITAQSSRERASTQIYTGRN